MTDSERDWKDVNAQPMNTTQTTPSEEWESRFDEKWRLYMGDCNCNKEAFFKPFIRETRTAAYEEGYIEGQKRAFGVDRARVEKEGYEKGVRESAKIVEGWHINKGGYTELAHVISTLLK